MNSKSSVPRAQKGSGSDTNEEEKEGFGPGLKGWGDRGNIPDKRVGNSSGFAGERPGQHGSLQEARGVWAGQILDRIQFRLLAI